MTRKRNQKSFLAPAALMIAAAFGLILAPAGQAQDRPDPDAKSALPLPRHDPEAMSGGRTVQEIAEDLRGAGAYRQNAALEELMIMGVDALPAREEVRYVAEHTGDPGMSDTLTDKHRLQALSTLYAMRAPETVDLLRQKILDPEYLTNDASYVKLIEAANQVGVDHETQIDDLSRLVDTEPEHATRLLTLDALDAPVQAALEAAIDQADAGDDETRNPAMTTSAEQEKDVEDAVLPEELAVDLLSEVRAQDTEQEISIKISLLETMVRDLPSDTASEEEKMQAHGLFADAMGTLIEGSSEMHAVAGIKRQVLFLQRTEPVALAPALEPIFALIEGGAGPAVHNAAAQALQQSPARLAAHDPEYFIERTVALLWSSDTPEQAELPLSLLTSLIQSPDYVDLTVDTIAGQIDPHQDKWTVNPAAAAVMHTGQLRRLAHTPVRETAGAIMGQTIASPALDMDYLGDHFARGGGELATLDGNTVEGVIAVFSPTIFAEEKPVHYAFSLDSFMEPMLGRPAWLQRDPDGLEHWIAFLGRVAALDDPDFSPVAREALKAF